MQRLGDDVADFHARIERGIGILQHDLAAALQGQALASPTMRAEVVPADEDRARGRPLHAHDEPARWSTCPSRVLPTRPSVSPRATDEG